MQEAIGKWSFQQNVLWGTTTEEVYEVIYIEPRSALQIKRILVEDKDDAPKVGSVVLTALLEQGIAQWNAQASGTYYSLKQEQQQ